MAAYKTATDVTKRLMADSLLRLMEGKPIQRISIKEITDGCQLNRQTFYYHFQDIYALAEWTVNEEIKRFLDGREFWQTWQQVALEFFEFVKANHRTLVSLYRSIERAQLKSFLYPDLYKLIRELVEKRAESRDITAEQRHYTAHFYTVAFAGLTESWLTEGAKGAPQEMLALLSAVIDGGVEGTLGYFERR